MMQRLLIGGAAVSSVYLGYRLFYAGTSTRSEEEIRNCDILSRLEEARRTGVLKDTPFPAYLEIERRNSESLPSSLCVSIQNQLERDWNSFIFQLSKLIIK